MLLILTGCLIKSCICENGSIVHPRVHLHSNYNIHEAPIRDYGVPIDVNFTINLRNILEVNEVAQIIALETSIRLFWKDWRVNVDLPPNQTYMTLNPIAAKHFWIPDIFIDRSKVIRDPAFYTKPASTVKFCLVHPDETSDAKYKTILEISSGNICFLRH